MITLEKLNDVILLFLVLSFVFYILPKSLMRAIEVNMTLENQRMEAGK